MQWIAVSDVLEAMERNIRLIIELAGRKAARIEAIITYADTASVNHRVNYDGTISATVYFPALSPTARIAKSEADRWSAYFLHEVSHCLYTDPATWETAVREGLHAIVNGLEDVRIERELIRAAVSDNARALLTELVSWAISRTSPDYDPNDATRLPWTLAMLGRYLVAGYPLPEARPYLDALRGDMRAAVLAALQELEQAKSTADVLKIARRLCGRDPETGSRVDPPQGNQGNQGQGNQGQGNQGQGQGNQGDEPQGDEPQGDEPQGDETQGDEPQGDEPQGRGQGDIEAGETQGQGNQGQGDQGQAGTGQGAGAGGGALDPSTMQEVNLDPLSDRTRQAVEEATRTGKAGAAVSLAGLLRSVRRLTDAPRDMPLAGSDRVSRVSTEARRAALLRQQTARVLKAQEDESWSRARPAGRIDRTALARIGAGETQGVYAVRSISEGFETEIVVLVDGSGSMADGRKLLVTAALALAIAQAADQVGVACEVVQFQGYNRYQVKRPTQRVAGDVLKRFGKLAAVADGGTPLSPMTVRYAQELARRAAHKRRILFAVTDGHCEQGRETVRAAAEYAASLGVETICLSIDSPKQGAFQHEVRVDSRGDVAQAGFGALLGVLENGARR